MSDELEWDLKDGRWLLFKNKRAVMWMQYGWVGKQQVWKLVRLPVHRRDDGLPEFDRAEFDCIWEAQAMGKLIAASSP